MGTTSENTGCDDDSRKVAVFKMYVEQSNAKAYLNINYESSFTLEIQQASQTFIHCFSKNSAAQTPLSFKTSCDES